MADILLIHGAAHGAWCWRDTIPELTALGHKVEAIDLPSHGDDPTPVNDVTLDHYAARILEALDRPRIIVGHSMAGYPISLVAERAPHLVEQLIYLCAYVPKPGYTLTEMRKLSVRQPLVSAFVMAEDGRSFTFDPDLIEDRFYKDCSPEQIAYAAARLTPQATATSAATVTLTAQYARVKRSYIRCRNDNAIPYELQLDMTEGWPDRDVVDMETSHSPFFSAPRDLAQHIDRFICDDPT